MQLQVEAHVVTIELPGHVVVGAHGLECTTEGAKPKVCAAVGLADLGHPLALGPLADTIVGALLIVQPALAFMQICVSVCNIYMCICNIYICV